MKQRITLLMFAVVCVLSARPALGAIQRTFVSVSGNDSNVSSNCGRMTPCRSFAAAMTVTGDQGEIVALDSGGYGRVTVNKSVTISAPAGIYAGISVFAGTNGIDINTPNVEVVLQGLTINGQGGDYGIWLDTGGSVSIEDCVISNMEDDGILAAGGVKLTVKNCAIRDCSTAVRILTSARASVVDSLLDRGLSGIMLFAYESGSASLTVVNTVILNQLNQGFWIDAEAGSSADVSILTSTVTASNQGLKTSGPGSVVASVSNCGISKNSVGIWAEGHSRVSVSGCTITRNSSFGLTNGSATATILSRGNNTVHDNNPATGAQTYGVITTLAGM